MTYDFKTHKVGGFYSWVSDLEKFGRISIVMTRDDREKAFAEIDSCPTERDAQKYVYSVIVGQHIARATAAQISKAKQFLFDLTDLRTYLPALVFKAQCYEQGIFFDKSPAIAFGLYTQALKLGDARAALHLSRFYSSGKTIPANEQKSLALLHQAAAAGVTGAKLLEGLCYSSGINGYPCDPEKGKQLVLDAAWQGNKQAMLHAVELYTAAGQHKLADFWRDRAAKY